MNVAHCLQVMMLFYSWMAFRVDIPYILESNLRPFYSFRGQMRIRTACRLDSLSWAGFWKNDRAAVHAVRTIQYNNLLFYLLFIIYYIIFIIYYSSDSPSSLITESVSLVGKGRLKERCGLKPQTNFFFRLRNRQKLVRIRFENIRYVFQHIKLCSTR